MACTGVVTTVTGAGTIDSDDDTVGRHLVAAAVGARCIPKVGVGNRVFDVDNVDLVSSDLRKHETAVDRHLGC